MKDEGVKLKADEEKLTWLENKKTGTITTTLAYDFLGKKLRKEDNKWWYKKLWKWKVPQKIEMILVGFSRK